jgi:hypothetical protein
MHAISDVAPICQACGLVICSLNSPAAPCPSCLEPLLPSSALLAMRTRQLGLRNKFLDSERDRLYAQLEEEAEEQARIKFPTLNSTAGHLSGNTLTSRVQQAYTQEETRKVLSLQLGTKKATVHTTTKKPKAGEIKTVKEPEVEGWIDQDDLGWLRQQENPPPKATYEMPSFTYVQADKEEQEVVKVESKTTPTSVPGSSQPGKRKGKGKA